MLPLITRLVNDDEHSCCAAVAAALKELLSRCCAAPAAARPSDADAAQAEVGALLWWLGQSGRPLLLEAASGVSEADGAKLVAAMRASGGRSEAVDVS